MNGKKILAPFILGTIAIGVVMAIVRLKTETAPLLSPAPTEFAQDENGNFILYVSNQSSAIDPVDVKIFIDGAVAVEQDFYVAGSHNWKKFQFSLSKGEHAIYAISIKGEVKLEQEFEIKDKHWAVIDYFYHPLPNQTNELTPRQLSFVMRDEPIYFE